MRNYIPTDPASLPEITEPDFHSRLREMLSKFDYWAQDASFGFNRIILGESPNGSGDSLGGPGLLNYLFKPGLSGSQLAHGGVNNGENLTLSSTSASTKGFIYLGDALTSMYDDAVGRLGINVTPQATLQVSGAATGGVLTASATRTCDWGVYTGSGGTTSNPQDGPHRLAAIAASDDDTLYLGQSNAQGNNPAIFDLNGTVPSTATTITVKCRCRFLSAPSGTITYYVAVVRNDGKYFESVHRNPITEDGLSTSWQDVTFTIDASGAGVTSGTANSIQIFSPNQAFYWLLTYFEVNVGGSADIARFQGSSMPTWIWNTAQTGTLLVSSGDAITDQTTRFQIRTLDAVNIFSVQGDGVTKVNVPGTQYTTGNPVALTVSMEDSTAASGDNDFFKLRTNGTDILTVGYFGLTQIDMTINDIGMVIDQNSGATSDYMRFNDGSVAGNPRASVVKGRIDSNGAYGLVAGAAVGSVYTCTSATTGVGAWTAVGALTASFADNLFSIFDNSTPTKIMAFQLDSASFVAGTHTFRPPNSAAASTTTLAAIDLAQTFTKAQAITPDSDAISLTLNTAAGQASTGFQLIDGDFATPAFEYQTSAGTSGFPGLHIVSSSVGGALGLFLWPSGQIGVGTGIQGFSSLVTGSLKTFTFPNIAGVGLVRAAAVDRTNSTTGTTTNTATVLGAGATAGEYQINAYISTGGTSGDRVFKFELLWRDERADTAAADRVITIFSGFSVTAFVSAPANIGQYTGVIWHSGTTAIRLRSSLVSGTTGNYDLHMRVNAT